jgi:hypothetical protein
LLPAGLSILLLTTSAAAQTTASVEVPRSAKPILQSYVSVWRGAEVLPLTQEAVLAFSVRDDGGGDFHVVLSDHPGGTLADGALQHYNLAFELSIETLQKIDRQCLDRHGSGGRLRYRAARCQDGEGFAARPGAEGLFRRLCFYFWTRAWPKIAPFGSGLTRELHGGDAVVLY